MAQPAYAVKYIGGKQLTKGVTYSSTSILSEFPTATCLIMKSSDVSVSINGTDMFPIEYGDQSYIETEINYTFSKDCIVAVGIYKAVT